MKKENNTLTKTTRFYLSYDKVEETDLEYKELCKLLWKCQDEVRMALNEASTEYTLYVRRMMNEYANTLKWPKSDEVKSWYGCTLQTQLYRVGVAKTEKLGANSVTALVNSSIGKWNKDFKEYVSGKKAMPSFKGNQPIPIPKAGISLTSEAGEEYISFSFLSGTASKEAGLKNGVIRFKIYFSPKDTGTKAIVDNCINGSYQYGSGSMGYDKKKSKWYFSLTYSFPKQKYELGDNVCGVDLGVVKAAVCALNDGYDRLYIDGGEISEFRRRVERRRTSILNARPYANPGSVGHGTNKRMHPAFLREEKIVNFRDTKNKQYARAIVDFAFKHGCSVIQMEDLSGIAADSGNDEESKENNTKFLKHWTYYDLQQKIANAADEYGIVVEKIEPKYTSQRCHKCGHIAKENRKTQADFECVACGYTANADYNAAKNIATPGIAEIIAADMGFKQVKPNKAKKAKKTDKTA